MSSNPIRLKYLFRKYLDNACSRQELEEFWQLMSELSENDLVLQELQEQWHHEEHAHPTTHDELDRVFERVQQKIDKYESGYTTTPVLRLGRRRLYISVAASLLLCMAIGWWYFNRVPVQPPALAGHIKENERRKIILPDGSTVILNHNSHLDYPAAFTDSVRVVTLTGEAYFDVQHDPHKPFIVHSGAFVTRVLGTAFNIKAYSTDSLVAITVERGKVQVQRQNNQKPLSILVAGDQLIIDKQSEVPLLTKADVKQVIQWKNNDLLFDNIRFEEAAQLIGHHFNVELRFRNEALRNCRFTVDPAGKSLEEILDILGQLTRSSWSKEDGHIIWLEGEGCKNE
ncbi:FecR domain-containing protein [Paraflavitalea speifideaquila]|uniref:FecR domain-containing protein n=1 Tax=Paraflavitalea speifideaquila TaxID=3076558 RepID=UPI0028EFDED0|nr:FecR domain-containing protein [Paraflavitalea speifideiaquila]